MLVDFGSCERNNLSQGQIMIRILACLCEIGSDGACSYAIQHRSHIKSQDSNRFKLLLQKLCNLNLIQSHDEHTSGENKRVRYKILENGKSLIHEYKTSIFSEIFGSIDDP